jgi:hypothetical protein
LVGLRGLARDALLVAHLKQSLSREGEHAKACLAYASPAYSAAAAPHSQRG